MGKSIIELLHEALETGEVLTLCYAGGSKPGKERDIVVVKVDTESFWAGEMKTDSQKDGLRGRKQFKLEKVIWLDDSQGNRACGEAEAKQHTPIFDNLGALAEHCQEVYQPKGWHVDFHDDHLGLCRFFKNGKPRKGATVSISYIDRSTTLVWDLAANDLVEMPVDTANARPWRVDSERFKEGRTFGRLDRAIDIFLEEAANINPSA